MEHYLLFSRSLGTTRRSSFALSGRVPRDGCTAGELQALTHMAPSRGGVCGSTRVGIYFRLKADTNHQVYPVSLLYIYICLFLFLLSVGPFHSYLNACKASFLSLTHLQTERWQKHVSVAQEAAN